MANLIKFNAFPSTKLFPQGLLDDLFNQSITGFLGSDDLKSQPAVNVFEKEDSFQLEVAAPGFDKQDFSLNVEKDFLVISAKRAENKEEETGKYTRREFRFDAFERSFKLPATVNQDAVTAVYENGVLVVALPKKEEARSLTKTITIS